MKILQATHSTMTASRSAFSLVELIVVLVILAMISSIAVLSVGNTIDRHLISTASETIEVFDARLRREARAFRQPITASFNGITGELVFPQSDSSEAAFRLPRRVKVASLLTSESRANRSELILTVGTDGRSTSYAVELEKGESTQWLVVLGGSGQVVRRKDKRSVDELLQLERPK